jgi:hypothetical protein
MQKTELKRAMSQQVDGAMFITLTELTKFLGMTNKSYVKKQYLDGLERIGKSYFIPEVAERLMEVREV